ncbi:MAG TPA: hypothetical protein DCZ63_15135 [Geobacter sp.]|nr:hypothetical protein [Geobacter sp.]
MSTTDQLVAVGGGNPVIPLDTDALLAANSDKRVASQKAVKGYIDTQLDGFLTPEGLVFPESIVTASGALPDDSFVQLNLASAGLAMTLATPTKGRFLVITQIDAGTHGHTVTLGAGTWDGTNDVATFNAPGETLVVFGVSNTRFVIVENIGSVAFS